MNVGATLRGWFFRCSATSPNSVSPASRGIHKILSVTSFYRKLYLW